MKRGTRVFILKKALELLLTLLIVILFIFLSTLSFNILGKKLEKEDRADA